jgi:hypothetical protein
MVDVAGQDDGHVIAASSPAKSVSMGGCVFTGRYVHGSVAACGFAPFSPS